MLSNKNPQDLPTKYCDDEKNGSQLRYLGSRIFPFQSNGTEKLQEYLGP